MAVRIHPTADVSDQASIGEGTSVWHQCQIREGVQIGQNCILGKGVFVDAGVRIGDNVKIQNYVSVYHGVSLEDGVFVGPHVCFTNDMLPRAINPDGSLKGATDWVVSETRVRRGAALGANSTIRCGVTIGEWAMLGSGSVVTRDLPNYALAYGSPARVHGFVCPCGQPLEAIVSAGSTTAGQPMACRACGQEIVIPTADYQQLR